MPSTSSGKGRGPRRGRCGAPVPRSAWNTGERGPTAYSCSGAGAARFPRGGPSPGRYGLVQGRETRYYESTQEAFGLALSIARREGDVANDPYLLLSRVPRTLCTLE